MKIILLSILQISIIILMLQIFYYINSKLINKLITYFNVFALTILMTIGWLAHFGTIGKYIIWKIEDKEYSIYFPRIINFQ